MIEIVKRYFNKYFFLIVGILFIVFLCGFFLLKEQYYYEVVDRFYNYPLEFSQKYFQGDLTKILLGEWFVPYKEPYMVAIFSSIYLYFITFSTYFFQALLFLIPIFVFALIHHVIGADFYDQFYQTIIYRIGRIKYILGHFLGASLLGGLLCVFPKILYYIVLRCFFVGTYSLEFYVNNASWITEQYLFSSFEMNPYALFFKDLGISFLYGVVLAFISIAIISIVRGKYVSYIAYILVILVECVMTSVMFGYNQMLVNCYSYINFVGYQPQSGQVLLPLLLSCGFVALLFSSIFCVRKLWWHV